MSDRIPENYGEAHFQYNLPNDPEPMFTALGYSYEGDVFSGVGVGVAVLEAWTTTMKVYPPENYTLGPGFLTLGTSDGEIRVFPGGAPVESTGGAGFIPNNSALLVRKTSLTAGRRGRGRMYIPGVNVAWVNEAGYLDPGVVDNLDESLGEFSGLCDLITDFGEFQIFHESAPFTPSVVLQLVIQPQIATQRRRMRP